MSFPLESPTARALARTRALPVLWLGASLLPFLGGCGGGGGPANIANIPLNLRATTLEVISPVPTSAHEMEMATGVAATRPVDSFTIRYFVLNKEDVDADIEEPRQFDVGTAVYQNVVQGEQKYTAFITIPPEVAPEGDWYLISEVDPLDEHKETDENDNTPEGGSPEVVINVSHVQTNTPDIILETVTVDTESVLLDERKPKKSSIGQISNVENHHFGSTVLISTTGALPVKNVDLSVAIETSPGNFEPLMIWDRDGKAYQNEYIVPEIVADIPNSIHLDVDIPGTRTTGLLAKLIGLVKSQNQNRFTVRFKTNTSAKIGEWELGSQRIKNRADNAIFRELVLVAPIDPSSLRWEESFEKNWRNDAFTVGLLLRAQASLDDRGAIAQLDAEVPVEFYGFESKFFDFNAYAQESPNKPSDSRFSIDVDVLGLSVYSRGVTDPRYTHTEDWNIKETAQGQGTVWVGPVPVQLTAGSTATLGFRMTLEADTSKISLTAGPYANATAFAEAKVNLVVATAGVAGQMTLIDEKFTMVETCSLALLNNGTILEGTLSLDVTNELSGPSGRIYLFATYPGVKWCKVPLVGKVPCGFPTVRTEKTIVRFRTFTKKDVLFSDSESARVNLTQ